MSQSSMLFCTPLSLNAILLRCHNPARYPLRHRVAPRNICITPSRWQSRTSTRVFIFLKFSKCVSVTNAFLAHFFFQIKTWNFPPFFIQKRWISLLFLGKKKMSFLDNRTTNKWWKHLFKESQVKKIIATSTRSSNILNYPIGRRISLNLAIYIYIYLPNFPHGQDMTQVQFFNGVW